jgi:hypothetical protein
MAAIMTAYQPDKESSQENSTHLKPVIDEILMLLTTYFNQNWFLILVEDIPVNIQSIKEIHHYLSLGHTLDIEKIKEIVTVLDHLINTIKRYILPVIREKLRISYLIPHTMIKDKNLLVIHRLIACVFPYNFERLSMLTARLKCYCG